MFKPKSKIIFAIRLALLLIMAWPLSFLASCQAADYSKPSSKKLIQFEKIKYFPIHQGDTSMSPTKSRITYYFDNGLLYRWMERDSMDRLTTDYVAEYDDEWVQTGARYIELEAGDSFDGEYERERVTFSGDTLKTTEWLDSAGNVYYRMIEDLNKMGNPDRAAFIGEELHGYDSAYYTAEGFEKRIFFTNVKGRVFNDRSFEYAAINRQGDWTKRFKIINDTIREVQRRQVRYYGDSLTEVSKFMEGMVSKANLSQNSISFSRHTEHLFYTQGKDWEHQRGYLASKVQGLYTLPQKLDALDTVYNGALSPSGDRIIYCRRLPQSTEILLIEKANGEWSEPLNLTQQSGWQGGYFNWYNEHEIYFYTPEQSGDMVVGQLRGGRLTDVKPLARLNTSATEFSPFIGKEKKYLIFTRFQEGDPQQQGFFISYNQGTNSNPQWAEPTKIPHLPYGWGAFVSYEDQAFFFTDGDNIFTAPISLLGLSL